MGLFDLTTTAVTMEDFLERERDAILAGRFDVLERLGAEKERLQTAVTRMQSSGTELNRLRRLADRNGDLLAAMQRGVSAALQRIEAIRQGPGVLQTYDALGQRHRVAAAPSALQRRA